FRPAGQVGRFFKPPWPYHARFRTALESRPTVGRLSRAVRQTAKNTITMLTVDSHPLLDLRAFATTFPRPLGEIPMPPQMRALLALDAAAPLRSDDSVRE